MSAASEPATNHTETRFTVAAAAMPNTTMAATQINPGILLHFVAVVSFLILGGFMYTGFSKPCHPGFCNALCKIFDMGEQKIFMHSPVLLWKSCGWLCKTPYFLGVGDVRYRPALLSKLRFPGQGAARQIPSSTVWSWGSACRKSIFAPLCGFWKLSKSFKILLIERAVGFLPPPAHTPRCSVPDISARFF